MNRGKKDWMMDLFRGRAQVLIATEAGGEGINLQFCHHMINFDLPWNPMRVEQRIGRVHRLGQTEDVKIYNLCTLGTIEEHIVHLLHEKINMFELVIGELDHILERFEKKMARWSSSLPACCSNQAAAKRSFAIKSVILPPRLRKSAKRYSLLLNCRQVRKLCHK